MNPSAPKTELQPSTQLRKAVFGGSLFNLDQQIILETATVQVFDDANNRVAKGAQYGVGIRYQLPLNHSWILRADAMYGWLNSAPDVAGARLELRYKF